MPIFAWKFTRIFALKGYIYYPIQKTETIPVYY